MLEPKEYMLKAIELAKKGAFYVSPNPKVGCIIVHNHKIIGEGYHQRFGEAHAEVNAINSVKDKSLIKSADVYVSLEPCSFTGKTPPCADLLIKHQPKKVYMAMLDPNPKVAGNGLQKLKQAGIACELGLHEQKAKDLNPGFCCYHEKKRPFVVLKWAASADGFIAPIDQKEGEMKWISNPASQEITHFWRAEMDAILVGYNTVVKDDPSLNVRAIKAPSPIRIVWDPDASLSRANKVFRDEGTVIRFSEENGDVNYQDKQPLKVLMDYCYQHNITSIMVEGGAKTHQQFIDQELFDEIRIIRSETKLETGIPAAILPANLELFKDEDFKGDNYLSYRRI